MTHAASVDETDVWRDQRTVALLLAATLIIMANATISPALPGLESAFANHPNAELLTRLLVPAPSLTVLLFAPVAGCVVDRFGRRRPMLIGVLAFAITGTAGLFLNDLTAIFVSRLALGIAVAVIMTAQTALIGDYFTGNQRTRVAGLQVSARNFGGFVIIALAGWLAALSPELPFAIYGLAALYLPVMWAALPEPKRPPRTVGSGDRTATEGRPAWPIWLAALSCLQFLTNLTFFVVPTQLPFFVSSVGHNSASMTGLALGVL
ncbi:MAG: MFS transporter, partial [Pseudomonadota bacterium]